jgi:hypothetical protein
MTVNLPDLKERVLASDWKAPCGFANLEHWEGNGVLGLAFPVLKQSIFDSKG